MISMLCVSARVPRLKEKRPPLCPGFCGWDYGGGGPGGGGELALGSEEGGEGSPVVVTMATTGLLRLGQ